MQEIKPSDIRPGDVVERRYTERLTVERVDHAYVVTERQLWTKDMEGVTWYLVHRPDPDAWAIGAIRSASYNIWFGEERLDPLPGLRESAELLNRIREQGGDVVRRAES